MRKSELTSAERELFEEELEQMLQEKAKMSRKCTSVFEIRRLENRIHYRRKQLGLAGEFHGQPVTKGKQRANVAAYRAIRDAVFVLVQSGDKEKANRKLGCVPFDADDLAGMIEGVLEKRGWTWGDYDVKWRVGRKVSAKAFKYESSDDPEYRRAWGLGCITVVRITDGKGGSYGRRRRHHGTTGVGLDVRDAVASEENGTPETYYGGENEDDSGRGTAEEVFV